MRKVTKQIEVIEYHWDCPKCGKEQILEEGEISQYQQEHWEDYECNKCRNKDVYEENKFLIGYTIIDLEIDYHLRSIIIEKDYHKCKIFSDGSMLISRPVKEE